MSFSTKKITPELEAKRNPGNFYKSLRDADVIPLPESELIKNDNPLDKYIFESAIPTFISSDSSGIFKPNLSRVEEIDETELYDYGGGSRDSKVENDTILFIAILFMHGGYAIDNTQAPVTSITKKNAPLIKPGNKFDGYESLTICGAAPPSQINTGSPNLLNELYHPIVIENLFRFSELLTEKISSVNVPAPASVSGPASRSRLRPYNSRRGTPTRNTLMRGRERYFKKGGGGKKPVKSKPTFAEEQPQPTAETDTHADTITLVSSRPKSRLPKSSRFPKIISSIQKVSYGIKNTLFSLVKGCVKMVMNNFKVDYAFFDLSDERYNIIQKNIVNAIICMSQHGALKINDDLFDAFSYSLFWGLRQHDQQYFFENCRVAISQAEPGSSSHLCRSYAMENAYERFPCIRTIVKRGAYNANHVEKTYSYHPVNDIGVPFGVRIYKYNMISSKNDKGEISITPETPEKNFIDVGLDEIFAGKSPDPMLGGQFGITLSEISLFISNKINEEYFGGNPEKKRVSLIDISCASFFKYQPDIPDIPPHIGMGGRKKRSGQSKTKRRSKRNGRNGRNKSKIGNRRSRQSRKIYRK